MNNRMRYDVNEIRKTGSGRFTISWRGMVLAMLALFLIMSTYSLGCIRYGSPEVLLPDAVNSHYQPERNSALTIYISKDGTVTTGYYGNSTKDLEKFATMWEEMVENTKFDEEKVFMQVDKDAQYGHVVKVLEILAKANVRTVGLITNNAAALVNFTYKELKEYKTPRRHWRYHLRY